jgi:hypothetical protein
MTGTNVVLAEDEPETTTTTTLALAEEQPTVVVTTIPQPVAEEEPPTEVIEPSGTTIAGETVITLDPRESDGSLCPTPDCGRPEDTLAPVPPGTSGDGIPADTGAVVEPTSTTTIFAITHDEEAIVTGTQVANGNSGGNTAVDVGNTPTGMVGTGGAVDTGDAQAIGSNDENVIGQQADVVLTEEAIANILQIALILNIGAALAESGLNGINSSAAGNSNPGAIGTGDVNAVGLDIDQYITQAARVGNDESSDQLAVSLWLGSAIGNSGLNQIYGDGATGSGGGIGSGDALAIGNDSLSAINQTAAVLGSGTSQTDITQRATVLNLGFALANSGMNGISGVADNLLSAGDNEDDALAQDLFVMLLPALLQSYGYGAGAGTIATGDATAVGNRSQTFVQQLAMAVATGDGVASIVQDVLVANMGAAGANSGGNALGTREAMTTEQANAVVQMAAFLAQLLALVHQSSSATMLAAQTAGIEIPFGDLILQLSGSFAGLDTQLTSASGARANIRQISIVLSLGIARSNTGNNTIVSTQQQTPALVTQTQASRAAEVNSELAAVNAAQTAEATDAALDQIGTGNVDVGSETLVIICQRVNADDIKCLAPPPPVEPPAEEPPVSPTTTIVTAAPSEPVAGASTPPAATQTPPAALRTPSPGAPAAPPAFETTVTAGDLPGTGSDIASYLWFGFIMVVLGGCLLLVRRGKEGNREHHRS